jgi:hypothetical protein
MCRAATWLSASADHTDRRECARFRNLQLITLREDRFAGVWIPILSFSTLLIRAGAWNAYLPVLLPGRLLQLSGGALR